MPMGPSIGGFLYFTGVKFAGYSVFTHFLRKKWNDVPERGLSRTFAIGGIRTFIGVAVGISYWALLAWLATLVSTNVEARWSALFMIGLLPVRLAEWYWLVRIVFGKRVRGSPNITWSLVWGTIVSYVLDAIGIAAAFVIPGGMWVC